MIEANIWMFALFKRKADIAEHEFYCCKDAFMILFLWLLTCILKHQSDRSSDSRFISHCLNNFKPFLVQGDLILCSKCTLEFKFERFRGYKTSCLQYLARLTLSRK